MEYKELGKDFVGRTASNPLAWRLYRFCGRVSDALGRIYGHARFTREIGERDETLRRVADDLFADLTVVAGPFKGLKYPSPRSFGSVFLPKLLGTYESELHPALADLLAKNYTAIVDIGCADGYYAVGLGLKSTQAEVYAFDTDARARQLCSEMAKLNALDERIHIGGLCGQTVLRSIPLGTKALIISDCEGYESTLFTREIALLLAQHDLIIEAHDFIDIEISSRLRCVFEKTHRIRSIKSTDDIQKAHLYEHAKLDGYDRKARRLILAERRPAIMEWLVMTPLSGDSDGR